MTDAVDPNRSERYTPPEPVLWDALTLSEAIHAGKISCVETMTLFLTHISVCNPDVNAIVSLRSSDQLMAEAAEKDAQLSRGESMGWLHGFPLAVKDLAETKGLKTTMGSPLFADFVPHKDAIAVARLRQAGAIFIGKTNVPEFGLGSHSYNPLFGTTRNAYNRTLSAGGSSGGAAAALAMRMVPVADGSDMMGSLRNPGAFNNVFGLRPTFGRVPSGPAIDLYAHQLATEGPMARTAADLAQLLATQAGPHPDFPLSIQEDPAVFANTLRGDLKGRRIAWLGDWNGYYPMEKGIVPLCEQALETCRLAGCEVEAVTPGFDPARLWQCWLTLRQWALAGGLGSVYDKPQTRQLLKPEAQWEIAAGQTLSALDVHKASVTRSAWFAALNRLFDKYDFIALPTAQVFPFAAELDWPKSIEGTTMDTYHRWMEIVVPGTLSGCPVINLPVGFSAAGLPMGMQLIGRHRAELELLQCAHAYEQAAGKIITELPPFSGH